MFAPRAPASRVPAADVARPALDPVARPARVAAVAPAAAERPATHHLVSAAVPLQRKVGYEYELGDVTTYKLTGLLNRTKTRLAKFAPVEGARDGFKIEAEDPPTDADAQRELSSLELVTSPEIDDRQPNARAQAAQVLAAMATYVKALPGRAHDGVVTASGGAYIGDVAALTLEHGRVQATAGTSFHALARIRSGEAQAEARTAGTRPGASETRTKEAFYTTGAAGGASPAIFALSLTYVKNHIKLPRKDLLEGEARTLAAIVSMVVQIPINAWNLHREQRPLAYPKAAAGSLLARTDFAAMLQAAPVAVMLAISGSRFSQTLLAIINAYLAGLPSAGLAPPLTARDLVLPDSDVSLTLGVWFAGLQREVPTDRLTRANTDLPKDERESLESLGGFGDKTDEERGGTGHRPIVEFRSLPYVNPDQVVDAGLGIWDYLERAAT